jgi:SAM-dependent methyltransferase
VFYSRQQAESTAFPDGFFDLITVGQAAHWFDFQRFNAEVERVLQPGGLLALIGYSLFKTGTGLDAVIAHFYKNITGEYWDPERRHIDEHYQNIPFPFREISLPPFTMQYTWTIEEMAGYLGTWSAVQHFIRRNESDPVQLILPDLKANWGDERTVSVNFPLFFRVGSKPVR